MSRAHRGVLAEKEVPLHAPVDHVEHGAVGPVVSADLGQVVEAEVVVPGCRLTPVGLEEVDAISTRVGPEPLGAGLADAVDPLLERRVVSDLRHREVSGQDVEQRRDVRRALDARVPAQRHDPTARATDVAQQQLQDRAGADVLHADAVLRPADAVDERGGALASGVRGPRLAHLAERVRRHATGFRDHLGGVAGVVPLEDLVDAPGMLQRLVARWLAMHADAVCLVLQCTRGLPLHRVVLPVGALVLLAVELPGLWIVRAGLLVESREQAVEVLGVAEVLADDVRGVGVGDDVLAEVELVLQDVVDDPAEEYDVGPDAERHERIRDGAGAGEPRVDVDDLGAARLRLHDPLETDRVGLSHIRALDHDAVSVGQVLLESGGAATPEAGPQTGDGGGVSNTRLVLDLDGAHRGEELLDEVVFLVVEGGSSEAGDPERPAYPPVLLVDLLPGVPTRFDDPVRDHVHRRVEVKVLPLGAERTAVADLREPQRARDQVLAGRPLRAQPAARHGAVGVPFDLDDLLVLDEDPLSTPDRTVGTDALRDPVRGGGAGLEVLRAHRLDRGPAPQAVSMGRLPEYRP